jgi:hypothetical protein
MDALFLYFLTIGAGLAAGVGIVVVPGLWIYSKIRSKKESKVY